MPSVVGFIELAERPKIGDSVTLPAGLKYVNEFYALNAVSSGRTVAIVEIFRDEIYWRNSAGESCYARFRRKAA